MDIVGFSGGAIGAPILLPDGSAAAPALSFASDPDTGFWHNTAANRIDVSVGGTTRFVFLASGLVFDSTASKIFDANANEVIILGQTASAVNEVTVTNAATGSKPEIAATGDDANIFLRLKGKGTSGVQVIATGLTGTVLSVANNTDAVDLFNVTTVASAVNGVTVTGAATANAPSIAATGGDTNIGLDIDVKGAGTLQIGAKNSQNVTIFLGTANGLRVGRTAANPALQVVGAVANSVTGVSVTPGATGVAPIVAAIGSDTDITLKLAGKGTGGVQMGATGGYVGFYGTTPVALQTGVAVSAAGIHAALVNLGLITA